MLAVFSVSVPLLYALIAPDPVVCVAAASFIAAFTARVYTRTFAFARQRPKVAVSADLTNIAVAGAVLVALLMRTGSIDLVLAFLALAAGNIAAMALEIRLLGLRLRLTFRRLSLRRYLSIWRDARWSLLASTTTLVQSQAHSFLVSIFFGLPAFAPLAAGQVGFGPLRIMMAAWHQVMQPEVVLAIRRGDRAMVARTLGISAAALAGIVIAFGALFANLWTPLFQLLYAEKYAAAPMGWIVAGWCAITLCNALWCAPSGILQTFRCFRVLAMGTVYGGALSTIGVAILLREAGPEWSLLGVLLGESFMAAYTLTNAVRAIKTLPEHKGAEI